MFDEQVAKGNLVLLLVAGTADLDFLARVRELPGKGVDVVLDGLGGALSLRSFRALRPIYHDGWMELTRNLEWLMDHWDQPDEGIWETRGSRRDYTYSRLMSWVAVERTIRVARQRGLPADLARWIAVRDASTTRSCSAAGTPPARRSSSTTTPTCSTPPCSS